MIHALAFGLLGKRLEITPPNLITLDDQDCSNLGYEFIAYEPDDDVADSSGVIDSWASAGFVASDYEIRATKISGTTPTGSALATWISCASGASWQVDATVLTRRCTLKIEIRSVSTGIILDSCRVSLTATVSGGGEV